jgi:hypothetical protein
MSLRSNLRLLRLAVAAELRNPGLRALAVVGAVAAGAYAWNQGSLAGSAASVLSAWLGRGFGVAACLWAAYAAIRDQDAKLGAALRSKPVDGGRWVFLNWAGGLCVWLILLGAAFLGAAAAQLVHAGAASVLSHAAGFGRAAVVVGAMSTVSFALSRLMRSPLGGVLTMFAWFCAMAGVRYIPHYLRPDFVQNLPLYVAAAGGALCLAALVVERYRRGELRRPVLPVAAVLAFALLAVGSGVRAYHAEPSRRAETGEWRGMANQYLQRGKRVPGFWLPDGRGGVIRTSEYHGRILVIFLFDPQDTGAARTLPALDALAREFGERGVQPIGVCLSSDHADGWLLARGGGYHFPIGSDLTVVRTAPPPESVLATAYDAQTLPMLVVTDRQRRARVTLTDLSYDMAQLRRLVEERLAEEPE